MSWVALSSNIRLKSAYVETCGGAEESCPRGADEARLQSAMKMKASIRNALPEEWLWKNDVLTMMSENEIGLGLMREILVLVISIMMVASVFTCGVRLKRSCSERMKVFFKN